MDNASSVEILARKARNLHELDEACPDSRWFTKMTGAWAFTLAGTNPEAAWNGALACAIEAEAVGFAPVWGVSANRRAWVDFNRAQMFPDIGIGLGATYANAPSANPQTGAWVGDPRCQAGVAIQWLWSLSRLWVAVTSRHSDRAADLPLRMNRSM